MRLALAVAFLAAVVLAARAVPPPQAATLAGRVDALQSQLNAIQQSLQALTKRAADGEGERAYAPDELLQRNARHMSFQPMKRMVSWQPMKRSSAAAAADYSRDQMIRAIEEQLATILRAGETLGINAEEVLADLRQRNAALI